MSDGFVLVRSWPVKVAESATRAKVFDSPGDIVQVNEM